MYGYTGEQYDAATSLVYLRARYYDPNIKVFNSHDPFPGYVFDSGSQNGYLYVGNNPVNLVDPLGQCYPPIEFLRDVEPTNCTNLDMAIRISQSPNATGWQKTGAYTYIGFWSTSHAALVTGLGLAGGAGVQAIATWGAGFAIAHPTATTVIVTTAGVIDDAAVIYGAATGNPQAQQEAVVAQQIAMMDGALPFADSVAGVKFFGSRLRNGVGNFVETCSSAIQSVDNTIDDIPDLFAFGNTTAPRPPRSGYDVFPDAAGMLPAQAPPLPHGASTFADVSQAPLSGPYHRLSAGTQLPEGLDVIADGIDVIPTSPHPPSHHTIYPTRPMHFDEFTEMYNNLPWEYVGKKKK